MCANRNPGYVKNISCSSPKISFSLMFKAVHEWSIAKIMVLVLIWNIRHWDIFNIEHIMIECKLFMNGHCFCIRCGHMVVGLAYIYAIRTCFFSRYSGFLHHKTNSTECHIKHIILTQNVTKMFLSSGNRARTGAQVT